MSIPLLDSLGDLLRLARRFPVEVESAQELMTDAPLVHLPSVVAAMAQPKPAKAMRCPEEYLKQWREVLGGRRPELDRRAVRYLCWEPSVATDERFHAYLEKREVEIGGKALQGFVRSCHSVWSEGLAGGAIAAHVLRRLEAYAGPGRLLAKWQEAPLMILGPRGHEEFAAKLVGARQSFTPACEVWGVGEQTPYMVECARAAAALALREAWREIDLQNYLLDELLAWGGWQAAVGVFKRVVSRVILDRVSDNQDFKERLKKQILGDPKLGDPRLPANSDRWHGVEDDARRRFVQWLSQADIVFFFEHVMTRDQDWHGRKEFWLKYVRSLKQSRPLLNSTDRARLKGALSRGGAHSVHFGQTNGYSAFLLDFGPILVVEFSGVGAIYVYRREVINEVAPGFYTTPLFTDAKLKQRALCAHRKRHDPGWQYEITNVLARYGVRQG